MQDNARSHHRPESCSLRRSLRLDGGSAFSMSSAIECRPVPVIWAGRRMAAATTLKLITTTRRSSPATYSSSKTCGHIFRASSTAACSSAGSEILTCTPRPCSPRAGFTTIAPQSRRERLILLDATRRSTAAARAHRRLAALVVTALSSQRLIAIAEVNSLSDSRQMIRRPPNCRAK